MKCREMDHSLDLRHDVLAEQDIPYISLDQFNITLYGGEILSFAGKKVVKDPDALSLPKKSLHHM
jgi:hypothetical protein